MSHVRAKHVMDCFKDTYSALCSTPFVIFMLFYNQSNSRRCGRADLFTFCQLNTTCQKTRNFCLLLLFTCTSLCVARVSCDKNSGFHRPFLSLLIPAPRGPHEKCEGTAERI